MVSIKMVSRYMRLLHTGHCQTSTTVRQTFNLLPRGNHSTGLSPVLFARSVCGAHAKNDTGTLAIIVSVAQVTG